MVNTWLMAAVITFSMLITSALLLFLGIKLWLLVFDNILDFLNIKKEFIQYVLDKHRKHEKIFKPKIHERS